MPANVNRSPIAPSRLVDLFFRPSRYFAQLGHFDHTFAIVFCAFVMGMASSIDRINQVIISLGALRELPMLNDSYLWFINGWAHYWQNVLVSAFISALLLFYGGGWWYAVRLRWSDAKEVVLVDARRLYTFQEFVYSAPFVIAAIVQTFMYANYAQVAPAKNMWLYIALFFSLWSCWTSYAAVCAAYTLSKSKAMIFFLILPVVIYLLIFALQMISFDLPLGLIPEPM